MSPSLEIFEASLIFRVLKWVFCPLLFCAMALGGTFSQDDFTFVAGSYRPVFGAWATTYIFWAFYSQYESAVAGLMVTEETFAHDAREFGNKLNTLAAEHPVSWFAMIEFFVFVVTNVLALYLPDFGFQILWLTVGHFLFVVVWRTILLRSNRGITKP